ncbi:MAG: response regulator transcription factor, partial [Hungatella sp.]
MKIMVVDDFELIREDLCEQIAQQPDMEVVGSAASGTQAVELAAALHPEIILMDIEMESFNAGILAAEQIRDVDPGQKIIFLTAHETDQMIITAMGTGASDYIVKGSSEEKILQHIRNVYDGKPVLTARIQKTIMQEYTRLQRSERSLLFFINNVSQ